jgi:hypothetical protein
MQTIGDKQTESAHEPNMFISFCLDIQDTCVNFVTSFSINYYGITFAHTHQKPLAP